jgi:large subunit ribosomal protein L22
MAAVETPTEVKAEARYVRAAPRKAQLVAEQIRGRTVPEARTILAFMTRDAANDVEKVLNSAVANAEANHGLIGDELYVSGAYVGAGPTLKRWRARARGRVNRIRKRTCHITILLAAPEGAEAVVAPPAPTRAKPESAPGEETPKPRTRKPKEDAPAAEDAPAEETPAEEKPKRTRAAKPKAEAETAEAAEKPKPRARKKTETETTETDEGSES